MVCVTDESGNEVFRTKVVNLQHPTTADEMLSAARLQGELKNYRSRADASSINVSPQNLHMKRKSPAVGDGGTFGRSEP